MLALSLSLIGCASIEVPSAPAPQAVERVQAAAPVQYFNQSGQALPLPLDWWQGFNDPALTALVEQALQANRELDVARASIDIARAQLEREQLSNSYQTQSNNTTRIGRASAPNADVRATIASALGASWEIDAFGRIENAIKSAELNVEAAEQARRDVAVIVAAQTALAYTDLRGAQRRLEVAQSNAQTQAQSLELLRVLLANGRATELDLSRAEAQYRTTLANQPAFQAIIDGAISRLAVLTGTQASNPGPQLLALRAQSGPIPMIVPGVAIGAPQDLLRRRPDIRAAETQIARLLTLGEVERARLFPTITVNADISSLFSNANRLDQLSSFGFGFGPSISWEGPDLRRVRADIDIADAQTQRAYSVYEQTVLQALADIELALSNGINERQRQQDLILAANAAREARELAQLRFEEGLDDFLDVLEAQRTVLETEDRLAENRLQTTRLAILTYRELGGIE